MSNEFPKGTRLFYGDEAEMDRVSAGLSIVGKSVKDMEESGLRDVEISAVLAFYAKQYFEKANGVADGDR